MQLNIHPQIVSALKNNEPVVALESTIISHGMPYPANLQVANEIEAEVSGTIVKVLVNDSTPVEYDQPLFLVEPA